jgi:hypothetical protein
MERSPAAQKYQLQYQEIHPLVPFRTTPKTTIEDPAKTKNERRNDIGGTTWLPSKQRQK